MHTSRLFQLVKRCLRMLTAKARVIFLSHDLEAVRDRLSRMKSFDSLLDSHKLCPSCQLDVKLERLLDLSWIGMSRHLLCSCCLLLQSHRPSMYHLPTSYVGLRNILIPHTLPSLNLPGQELLFCQIGWEFMISPDSQL